MFKLYNHFALVKGNSAKTITNKILSRTKELTLSSKKYNQYLESFSEISQENIGNLKTDYDFPNIYPNQLNKNYTTLYKGRKTATPKMKDRILNNYDLNSYKKNNNYKKNSLNMIPHKENVNFFICDFNYSNRKEENYKTYENKFCITQENFINHKKRFKKLYSTGRKKEVYKDSNKRKFTLYNEEKKSEKQIFCLLNSVFTENKDDENKNEELKYEEKNIFGYKNIYLNLLKKELTSLTTQKKQINMNSNISHNYDNKIYGKIIMQLNSAKIEVINKLNDNLCCTVNIPFSMLCLFYLSTVKQLAYIILNIFKNDFLKDEKEPNMHKILTDIITNQISYKNEILTFKNKFDDQVKNAILSDYIHYRNLKYRTSVRYNLLSLNLKSEALKQIMFENCTYNSNSANSIFNLNYNYNIRNNNENIQSIKNLFDSNINIINLSWITLNNNYIIKIIMPQIVIRLPNYNKQINHFIDKQLLLFLYKNNFKNWNFYISHYLFTLKKFRICINNILSYYSLFNLLKTKNGRNFNFNNFKICRTMKEINKSNKDNVIDNNINDNISYKKYNISNLKFEQYENSLNDNEYIFLVSDDENIHLYKMKSYVLYVYSCSDLKNPKIFYFDFSFYQMKILFYKSKYENLIQFLQRLIKINNEKNKIYLDYYYFNTFKTMNIEQINHYFNESNLIENLNEIKKDNINKMETINNTINNTNDTSHQINENDLIFKVVNPKFISVSIKKNNDLKNIEQQGKWEKKEGEINTNLIKKLVENDIKNWGTILWQNKDGIEALKKNKNNEDKRKTNIFKDKKDFKAVFKKFLKIK